MDLPRTDAKNPGWRGFAIEALRDEGCIVLEGAISQGLLTDARAALKRAQERILDTVGASRLERAGELGTLRLPMLFDPVFFEFLALPEILAVVDETVGETAILHLQNGFVLPSATTKESPIVFANSFHRDFPRYLHGYVASINALVAIDEFSVANGATLAVPGSHQCAGQFDPAYLEANAVAVEADAGAILFFDSTLWHAAGKNVSGRDRLAINHQFTRSFIKQQIDYVRALGDEAIQRLPPRTQQLLGWYTRVVTSLDEFYRPEAERLYRRGQG